MATQTKIKVMRTSWLLVAVVAVAGGARAQHGGGQGSSDYVTCANNEVCAYWQHCHDGVINTGGIGLIDVRTPPPIPSNISNARPCESIGKLCCVDPNIEVPCPTHHLCVPNAQCVNGEINTSGIGLLDQRVRVTSCTNTGYADVDALCCKRPPPLPLVTCPSADQTCRYTYECEAASGTYETSSICYLDAAAGIDGVCCSPPVLPECSRGRVCVTQQQCTDQGTVNTDGGGIFNPRILDRCDLVGGGTGVCCLEPPPVQPPVEKCTQPHAVCSPTGYCQTGDLSAPDGYTETCYRTEGSGNVGECCLQPPVLVCPADHTCNLPHLCSEAPAALSEKPSCQLNSELVGVCCSKKPDPVVIVDVCPKDSVCLPEILCLANPNTDVISTACRLSGTGYSNPGVCCTNSIIDNTATPNVQCGVGKPDIDTRIKNSNLLHRQAKFAEFPWMAIVFFTNQTYKCGATLVDDRWVLTAAHCVHGFTPYDLKVRLGEYQVDVFDTAYPYEDYDIASITVHPDFNAANLHNDVAVLELSTPVTYRHHINRICLPPKDRVQVADTECISTGWGKDAFDGGKFQVILKKVSLPVVPHKQCENMLRNTRLGRFFILDYSFVCAGGRADKDACTGDGGGPLICVNPGSGRYELYGMTAWGIDCGIEGNPGVYVNVPFFMDWVYGILQSTVEQKQHHSAAAIS